MYVITPATIGTDAIKSRSHLPPGGRHADRELPDPEQLRRSSLHRHEEPADLAQTFQVNATGARFTVAVNHLKSKGSDCLDVGDPDLGDGQGNCSQTRRAAAAAPRLARNGSDLER